MPADHYELPEQRNSAGESKVVRPTLKPLAYIVILLLAGALAAGNYWVLQQIEPGKCADWLLALTGSSSQFDCSYYFIGAPLIVGLLLLLILPNLVTGGEIKQETKAMPIQPEPKKSAPPPAPPKPTTDAAVQLLALFQREGRLVDFLREDIQPYDDAQIGAAVRDIHQKCRDILAEHLTLERVVNAQEGDEVTIPKDFDPSAIRLTGNVGSEPPFHGALRHAGWRASKVKLPTQPSGQDPQLLLRRKWKYPKRAGGVGLRC